MSTPIRIMIVDDHHMVRSSIAMFLESTESFELVAQASNGREAVELSHVHRPDVILMDMMMPEMNGVEASIAILEEYPKTCIIALTSFKEDTLIQDALSAGVMSYILKNATLEELSKAITDAMQGRPTLAPEATKALIHAARNPHPLPDQLTPREREVLVLMVSGHTNRQIGYELSLGLSTVKFHVSSILSKLHATSRTEAVALAIQHNLLQG